MDFAGGMGNNRVIMPINDRMLYQRGPWVDVGGDDHHDKDDGSVWDNIWGEDSASTLIATSVAALTTLALAF